MHPLLKKILDPPLLSVVVQHSKLTPAGNINPSALTPAINKFTIFTLPIKCLVYLQSFAREIEHKAYANFWGLTSCITGKWENYEFSQQCPYLPLPT